MIIVQIHEQLHSYIILFVNYEKENVQIWPFYIGNWLISKFHYPSNKSKVWKE